MDHQNYPHEAGRLHGCPACEWMCHCNFPAIERGEETQCVFLGHPENAHELKTMTDGELDQIDEFTASITYDAELLHRAIKKVQKKRKKARRG